jgi:threonylcarbamoyladenosine tRNA methylthiotransferase MtaB
MSTAGPAVHSFGCRLNLAESEVMRGLASDAGLAEAIIVHTCAVTAEAERQARQAVRRAARERPGAPIVVAGCAATLRPESFARLPGVVRVLDNARKLDPAAWAGLAEVPTPPPPASRRRFAANTRGFVPVQQGCDHSCTFCTIPHARGPNRSTPVGQIVTEIRDLLAAGHREIVLTGVDLTAWGSDLPGRPVLGELVRRVLHLIPELPRLRLSSLDPAEIDEALWRALAEEERLMPHLHLSAQSGDDLVLKQMKRRHSRAQMLAVAERARAVRPGIALGADLIAGFPTEGEAQFAQSLALIEEAQLDYVHVFPYSPRPGTPAARLEPLPGPVVSGRGHRLRDAAGNRLRRRMDSLVGTEASVLVERDGTGHAECFARVRPLAAANPGEIRRLRLIGVQGDLLLGAEA